jgi:hypothetical protein
VLAERVRVAPPLLALFAASVLAFALVAGFSLALPLALERPLRRADVLRVDELGAGSPWAGESLASVVEACGAA